MWGGTCARAGESVLSAGLPVVAQCVPENGPVAAPSPALVGPKARVSVCASESFVPGPHDARMCLGTALEALGSWGLVRWLLWFSLVCVAVAVTAIFHRDSAGLLRSASDRPRSGRVTECWKSSLTVLPVEFRGTL